MRKLACLPILLAVVLAVHAEGYQIRDVRYDLDGRTREYALDETLDIRRDLVLQTREELELYVDFISQKLTDQRVLEDSSVEYELGAPDENGITPVTLRIYADETWNIFPLPYPKYSTNSGWNLKLKVKDYNFLGTMETLNFDLEFYQEDEGSTNSFGVGFDFAIPFPLGVLDAQWNNDAYLSYTIGDSRPEFSFSTGLDISYAFKHVTLQLEASQSVEMEADYRETGDETYGTEFLKLSAPVTLLRTTGPLGNVNFTPHTSATYNWDLDGVRHEDLVGPAVGVGYSFSAGKVNWLGNFRKGLLASFSHSYTYNFHDRLWSTVAELQFEGFYFINALGISTRAKFFTHYDLASRRFSDTTNVADWLRGVYDDESYNSGRAELPAGFVLNLDFPIRVLETDWIGWGEALFGRDMPSWLAIADFELQVVPFVDIALYGADDYCLFHLDDGFYAAGLELVFYPAKMRSIQVRIGAGLDLGARLLEQDWRSKNGLEIEFGVGLHY